MTITAFDALNSVSQIISAGDKDYSYIFKPEGTVFNPPLMYFYTDPIDGFFNLFIVESGPTTPAYMPDWLSEAFQVICNQQVDILLMRQIQEWTYEMLKIFKNLCQMRAALWWWLMFNPYQQPFNTLRVLTEWYLTAFTGVFPVLVGIDIGPTIGLALLGNGVDILGRLAFTMPYLPTEGKVYSPENFATIENPELSEMLTEFGRTVRVFRQFPELWKKYPIPNSLREDWYTNKPEITEYLIKNYYSRDIDFLPDRLLKELYEKSSAAADSLSISFNNLESLSTNLVCWAHHFVPDNLIHINL